jgi:hypothetical protein
MFTLYFFGSEKCKECRKMLLMLYGIGILNNNIVKFKFIDALADEYQTFCDEHNVDELPHVKLYDIKNNLIFTQIGSFKPEDILDIIK